MKHNSTLPTSHPTAPSARRQGFIFEVALPIAKVVDASKRMEVKLWNHR